MGEKTRITAKRIKVALFSFYSGEIYRGVETYVHELANRLVDLDIDVCVYQNGKELPNSKYEANSSGFKINWERPMGSLYWSALIGRHALKTLPWVSRDTDILVATNGGLQTLFARIWCFFNRKKLIISGQSGPGGDDKWNLLCFPDCFVALTNWQEKWARKFNSLVNTKVIPNGVDLDKFSDKVWPLKIDLPKPVVLSVGALVDEKRLGLAIRAVAKTKASLLLVGSGRGQKELQNLGNQLLPGRFKIMSFPHSEMPQVYAACDVFTYPTVPWESFGIVMVEAMASGLAVVASDDPIRREIVGDAGIFIDPIDTKKYTEALHEALNKKWGSTPRKQAERYDWDDIAKKYKELFLSIV